MQHKFTPTTHLKRAALTLLALISVTYIDENGQTQTVNATQITSDNLRMYSDRWYYVSGTVDVSAPLRLMTENGTHNLILCDGATLTVSQVSQYNSKYAKLKVYGQSGGTGKLNVGNVSMMNAIFNCDFALYGGEVTLTYYSSGHGANMNVDFNGGKLTATSGANAIGGNTTINATSGWIKASKYGGSVTIVEGKYMKDETGRCYKGTLTDAEKAAAAGKTLQPATQTEYISYIFGGGNGSQNSPYLIGSTESWNYFCDALQDNNTWNHFSGKTVKLGANISITQSAGSAGHEFMGTFDGDGKTLNVDITETTTQGTAPFREIKGATIQNLVVTGSVIGTIHAAGLVGFARGADANTVNTITNCKVATNVTVTTPSGNNYHCGGVVGHAFHCTLNMSNTIYCGDITNSGNYVGGLQGWSDGNTINFSHCLFAGSYSGTTTGTASFHPVAVRYNNSATTADVSHVYYTVTPTLTNSNYIAADGTKTISRATAPATIGDQTQSLNFMSTNIYQYGICYNNLYYATIGLPSGGTDIYLIDNADDWLYFCEMLNDNDTWNRFSGKTVKLGADISVSRMAGNVNHDFTGTFDGNGHTLTFNHTAADNYCAPFRYVQGSSNTDHAIIQNLNVVSNITAADYRHPAGLIALQSGYVDVTDCNAVVNINCTKGTNNPHDLYPAGLVSQSNNTGSLTVSGCTVSGTISTDGKYAAGMVGIVQSSASITNSVSSVTINSSTSGDGTHSGFVASLPSGRHLTIEGCVFNGKIVTTNGTTNCGGFLGHNNTSDGTGATITNCLYAPAADPNTVSTGCATFGRNVSSDLISNCYYTTAFGDAQDAQGTQAYSITAGEYVTLANAGTVSNNYTTSGLTFYNAGLKYGDVLYAAANDEVSLTLAHQDREGYDFIGYTATAGNLNGSSLTMPDGNVTINAEYTYTAPSELTVTDITFTTATLNWNGFQESYSVRYRTVGVNEWQTIDNIAATTTTLSGLLSGTTYEWQVQGLDCNSEGSTTEWSEAGTFTTLNPCEAPSELTATDITATTTTLNWNGLQESYSVRYRPVILYEGFESGTMPDGWTRTNEYWEVTSGTGHLVHKGAATGNYNAGCYTSYSNDSDILITPVMDLGNVASATLSFNFWNTNWDGDINILKVHYRVNGGEWQSLYTYENATEGWIPVTINLEGMAANYQIGFECEGHYSYGMGIDDVMVTGINTSEWTTVTNVSSPHNLTGLTPETQYLWQVQGLDCNGEGSTTEWSVAGIFTTLPLPLPVSYIDENGETQQCTDYLWLTGTETTLGAAGQETWCVVHSTLDYSQGIQLLGNTHIILCDGAAMNIGTIDNPVSGSSFQEQVGFYGDGNNLSLYAQSGNTGALTIYSQSCSFFVKDLTIAGGNVNATSLSDVPVIFCDNLTVRRSSLEVHANYYAAIQANNDVTLSNVTANIISPNGSGLVCSNFAVDNSQLTVNARYQAIEASNVITLSNVTANINSSNGVGLDCSNFTVDHSQLTVTALYQAIQASNVITLGCIAATDFIKATNTSSLTDSYSGTVKIADGQTLYAGANAYTGTLTDAQRQAIGGQKLTNVAPPTYDYIDLDGTGATHTAVVIDADNMPTSLSGWYIVQGTVNYTNTINLGGDTHIILADNAVMNVTASEGNYGIQSTSGNNYSLFVYGQTGQSGELNVTSNSIACFISGGDITIAGGKVTASGRIIGLYAQYTNNNGGNVTIKNATVTATGTSYFGIFAEYGGNITIDNSNVTATSTGSYGIYDENGNITIDNSNVTATSTGNHGIYAKNGNITIASGTVTSSSTKFGIYTEYGSVTINGGQVTTTGSFGIYTVNGSVAINGGQVSATGNIYGIYAQNPSDNITLGWTNPTDYIYANKYDAGGTLSIAEGKTFIDEYGQTYSGTIAMVSGAYAIDGKTLYPYSENAVPYLDENGQQRYCVAYTTLTGTETELGTAGQETWYVVDSDVSFTDLTINGDIHLILVDGKTMNLNHEQGFVTLWGQANLTIYGQTNGTGTLSSLGLISAMNITINGGIVNVKGDGFFKEENYIPAIWCVGDMVINGGKVYAQGDMGIVVASMGAKSDDMTTYNFTLNGGQVTAIGMSTDMGIIATGNITLGWTNPTDYIYANKYYAEGTLSIASSKTFVDENNTPYSGTIAQVDEAYAIDGKTLYPDCVVMKQVAGYGEGNGGWVFIASPVAGSIAPSEVHNLFPSAGETSNEYDLYRFDQSSTNGKEWQNWKQDEGQNNVAPGFSLVNGQGYLYASKETRTLVFAGEYTAATAPVEVPLDYDATAQLKGWNLVGNPFAVGATLSQPYYRMNAEGTALKTETETTAVAAMEGVFVQATTANQKVTFTAQTRGGEQAAIAQANIMVGGDNGAVIDNAIIRFDGGQTLEKFSFREGSTKIYIPQDGTDYAIACAESTGEMPVNFKAEENGTYTLTISTTLNSQLSTFNYLHLIDNLTGADVDLLTPAGNSPSERGLGGVYTFTLSSATATSSSTAREPFKSSMFLAINSSPNNSQPSTLNSQLSTTPRACMYCALSMATM